MANKPKGEEGKGLGLKEKSRPVGRERKPRLDNLKKGVKPQKMGRPTDYRPEYPAKLTAHMAEGYSFESFGALVDAGISTLYLWCETHPEFLEAKEKGQTKRLLEWEKINRRQATEKDVGSPTSTIFTLKCIGRNAGWADEVAADKAREDFEFSQLPASERAAVLAKARERRECKA